MSVVMECPAGEEPDGSGGCAECQSGFYKSQVGNGILLVVSGTKDLLTPSDSVSVVLAYIVMLGNRVPPPHSQTSQCMTNTSGNASIDADAWCGYNLRIDSLQRLYGSGLCLFCFLKCKPY